MKTVTTDAEAFAIYEAFLRAAEEGNEPLLDLSDTGFYGSSGEGLSAAELQQENIDLSAQLIAGERGVGASSPVSVQAVSQIAEALMAQVNDATGLAAEPDANFTVAEREAQAEQLSADMIAQFEAQIATDPSAAAYLPSTPEEKVQFNQGVLNAMENLADARAFAQKLLAGDTSPENIGLAVATAVRAATSILKVLPLPPAAKAVVNVVNMATYLAPGIVAAAKGDGDPAELLTIALQMTASILSWGVSDYFFDYIAPVIISAAVNAELGANGLIDLSPAAVTQGLIEAAVHDNGGTLPDWWYSASGGSSGNETSSRAQVIADAYGGFTNSQSYFATLSADIRAKYGVYGKYYQELTLDIDPNLGETRYYFAFDGRFETRPTLSASNIVFPGVDPNTTNPWDFIHLSNNPAVINGGLYILEKDAAAYSTSDNADTVYAPAGRPVNLLGGNDSFNFAQDGGGGTAVSAYYRSSSVGSIDGGDGWDLLSTAGLTQGNPDGYTGDIVVDHNTVRFVKGEFYGADASNFRILATHSNFEEFHVGDLRLFDMRQAAHSIKLVTADSFDAVSFAEIYGSSHGDTLIIDTGRLISNVASHGNFGAQNVSVDAGTGHDYVAGELVDGASYEGGSGIDTFEILAPDVTGVPAWPADYVAGYSVTFLDLETGSSWMRSHATEHNQFGNVISDTAVHLDTQATVTGFEWAVGSQYHDTIYALNSGSRLRGQGGNDVLHGRDGSDQLYGGDGNDALQGGGGTDRLQGGAGNDTLDGGAGRDVIMGGSGHDNITDLQGGNLISGGTGNDVIRTGDTANEIHAGANDDHVTAGAGNDTISLGTGLDELDAGAGDDKVTDVWASGHVSFHTGQEWSYRNAVLDGGAGYDVLTVDAAASSKFFTDAVIFDETNFSYTISTGFREYWTDRFVIDDPVTREGHWEPVYRYHEYRNFEEIRLTGGDFTVDLLSYADVDFEFTHVVDDYLINNVLQTDSGNDSVNMGAGDDLFYGNLGNDTVSGEYGSDTIDYSRLADGHSVRFAGLTAGGAQRYEILDSAGVVAATDEISDFEHFSGTANADALTGTAAANTLTGGGGNDTLTGGAGLDRFAFGANDGADQLTDIGLGETLVFTGATGETQPSFSRTLSNGVYSYELQFGSTSVAFTSADYMAFDTQSTVQGGQTRWEMTLIDNGHDPALGPLAQDDLFSVYSGGTTTLAGVLFNDEIPLTDQSTIVSFDSVTAKGGTITQIGTSDSFLYTPDPDFYIPIGYRHTTQDSFSYTVSDGTHSSTATVTIDVWGENEAPTLGLTSATTTEGTAVTLDVLAEAVELDANVQLYVIGANGASHGSLTYDRWGGTVVYTPDADFEGTDTFQYIVGDWVTATTQTVTITVTGAPDAPVAVADTLQAAAGEVASLAVLANDIDVDPGDVLSIRSLTQGSNGTVIAEADGTLTYRPNDGFTGTDSFTYIAEDSTGLASAPVTVTVEVADRFTTQVDTVETGAGVTASIDVLGNDTAIGAPQVTEATQGSGGTVAINADGTLSYTPGAGTRSDSFTYTATDQSGFARTETVTVTVNDAPQLSGFGATAVTAPVEVSGLEDGGVLSMDVGNFGFDANGDTLSVRQLGFVRPDGTTAAWTPAGPADTRAIDGVGTLGVSADGQMILFTPTADWNGELPVWLTVVDSYGAESGGGWFGFSVTPVNDAPVASDITLSVAEDGTHSFDPLAGVSDSDGDPLQVMGIVQPAHGQAVQAQDGQITYTPDADYNGPDSFSYVVSDGTEAITITVDLTVTPVNDAPVASPLDPLPVAVEGSEVSVEAGAAFTDADLGDRLTFSAALADGTPLPDSLTVDPETGLLSGTLPRDLTGATGSETGLTVVVTASDGMASATVNVDLTVQIINEAPVFAEPAAVMPVGTDVSTPLDLSSLALADGDSPSVTLTVSVDAGRLTAALDPEISVSSAGGVITLTGAPSSLNAYLAGGISFVDPADQPFGQSGQLSLTLTDVNGAQLQNIGPIALDVTGVEEITRVQGSLRDQTGDEDGEIVLDFSGLTLIDGDDLMITLSGVDAALLQAQPAQGITIATSAGNILTLSGTGADIAAYLAGPGNITFTPPADANGSFGPLQVSASALDGTAVVAIGEIGLTVTPAPDAVSLTGLAPQSLVEGQPIVLAPGVAVDAPDLSVLNQGLGDFSGASVSIMSQTPASDSLFGFAASPEFHLVETGANSWELHTAEGQFGSAVIRNVSFQSPGGVNDIEPRLEISFGGGSVTPSTDLAHSVLRAITYDVASELPSFGMPQLVWSFAQPDQTTASQTVPVSVAYVDDPFSFTAPATPFAVTEDSAGVLDFSGMAGSDPDSGLFSYQADISVSAGSLSLKPGAVLPSGVTLLDSGAVRVTSFVQLDLGSLLGSSLIYTPPADLSGPQAATLDIQVTGNSFTFGNPGYSGTHHFGISIASVNDAAVLGGDLLATMTEGEPGVSGRITISDIDSPEALQAGRLEGSYGYADLQADGRWVYTRTAALDHLEPGQSVTDSIALLAADGTPGTLEITIEGVLSHQTITGTAAGESLSGGSGNDTITGMGGDDTITGGAGFDFAAYLGNSDEFTFAFAADGSGITVTDTNGLDGLDEGTDLLLAGTDAIIFADGAVGEITWQGGQPVSMDLRKDGQLIHRLKEAAGGSDKSVTYQNGAIATVTYTDNGSDGGAAPWASRTQTFNSSGQVAQSEIVFDDGSTRTVSNSFENGVLIGRTLTDGAGSASSARWQSVQQSLDADGKVLTAAITFDDGTARSKQNLYTDGVRTGQVFTDGSGAQSSANWQQLVRSLDADGQVLRTEVTFDDGTARVVENSYSGGVRVSQVFTDGSGAQSTANWQQLVRSLDADGQILRTEVTYDNGTTRVVENNYSGGIRVSQIVTDGSGAQSSADWSRLEQYFGANGGLERKVTLRDNGDRITSLFDEGILTSRTYEDLNGDQPFESKTTTFANDGAVIDTSFVWDVIG